MSTRPVTTEKPVARPAYAALPVLLLALLALAPRIFGLADFLTTDEAYHWISRSERFYAALEDRRWADTLQTGHPGVTIMWLGSLGLALERLFTTPGIPLGTLEHLAWLRLPHALLEALLVPIAYLLLRRLVAPAAALAAGLLWACSPYLIAHARLLHLDALLTTFVTFSVLLLLIALQSRSAWPWMLGSGICAGLALLTKGPALILLPFAGLLMLGLLWHSTPAKGLIGAILAAIPRYLVWLAVALLVVGLLWPALWVNPTLAIQTYVSEIVDNGGRPNGDGQFFFGQAIGDPGWLFYPTADLFRTTPLMLLGLLASLGGIVYRWRVNGEGLPAKCFPGAGAGWRSAGPHPLTPSPAAAGEGEATSAGGQEERNVRSEVFSQCISYLALLALVLFWTLVMTSGPKKFDRYVLPTWPALLILAGGGLALLWELAGRIRRIRPVLAGLALAIELSQPAFYHPYYLSYYNPLPGGGQVAQRIFLIGWGEGMDQIGAYLRSRPDIGYGPVLSALGPTLQPFVPVPVKDVDELGRAPANYAVVYLESIQRAANPPLYAQLRRTVPLHRVTIHGIDYAEIYQLPRPFERPLDARFGAGLGLHGFTVARTPGQITITPAWDVRARIPGDYLVFLHLLDSQGRRVAQIDVAPGGGDAPPTGAWQPGQQIAVPLPLPIPADLPPGQYQIIMGLYEPASGQRLPLEAGPPADPALAGPGTLLLETLQLP